MIPSQSTLLKALAGTQRPAFVPVEDQDVPDIMMRMMIKFEKTKGDYDKIYKYFEGGDLYDVCERIWTFCRSTFNYVIEDEDVQNVSSPITMLLHRDVDCKNYSLFIAGILDAMRRHGAPIKWEFRFASYKLFAPPGHVFVVVNPNRENIWVDPVLPDFDYHLFYWHGINKRPKGMRAISGIFHREPRTIGSAEGDLLTQAKAYADGLVQAMQVSQQTKTFNTITKSVLTSASKAIPGMSQALQLVNALDVAVNNKFGPGSPAARAASGALLGGFVGALANLFSGRTYNTDQYWAAVYYQNKVLGRNVTDQSQVADGDVIPALKWFMDRLGVFISGREHILALIQSPAAYIALAKVNSDTTTDLARVTAAYQVASRWFTGANNFADAGRGSWANTVGVYDAALLALAQQLGVTPETIAAETGDQYAQQDIANSTLTGGGYLWLAVAAVALVGVALTFD